MWTVDTTAVTTDSTVATTDGFSGVGAAQGVIRRVGPGPGPDTTHVFDQRQLSAQILTGNLFGVASGAGSGYGALTGIFIARLEGVRRGSGPGPSPDYTRTFESFPRSTQTPIIASMSGVAIGQGSAYASYSITVAMNGVAVAQGVAVGAVSGTGALQGNAVGSGSGFGFVSTGTLTQIAGIAVGQGSANGFATGAGALTGVANAAGTAYGQLTGSVSMAGVAVGQGTAYAKLSATGSALVGIASGAGTAFGNLVGLAALQGFASGSGTASGTLLGTAALAGVALGQGSGFGTLLGAGQLTGTANGQAVAFGSIQGAAPIQGVAVGQSSAYGLLLYVGAGQIQGIAVGSAFAYGSLAAISHSYGWSTVNALSQNGLPVARACYIEESAARVTAEYFDTTGVPFVPNAVRYRIDDVLSGSTILDWTDVGPSQSNTVIVTSAQNAMISLTRSSETHQVMFEITDGTGNKYYQDVQFDLIRVAGLA